MSWIRQDEFLDLSGVFGWPSVPVIHDWQSTSANFTKKFNEARNAVARAFAPTAAPVFA